MGDCSTNDAYAQDDLIRQRKRDEYQRNKEKYLKRAAKYQKDNKERVNELARKRWADDPEKYNAYKSQRRKEDGGKRREREREHYLKNKEKIDAYRREWYAANKERLAEYKRKHRAKKPELRRAAHQRRKANKAGLPNSFTGKDWQKCLDYFGGVCAACGCGDNLQMDHWVPLTAENCPGTILTNMIPLCSICNNSKKNKEAAKWAVNKFGESKGMEIVSKALAYFDDVMS